MEPDHIFQAASIIYFQKLAFIKGISRKNDILLPLRDEVNEVISFFSLTDSFPLLFCLLSTIKEGIARNYQFESYVSL